MATRETACRRWSVSVLNALLALSSTEKLTIVVVVTVDVDVDDDDPTTDAMVWALGGAG